MVSEYFGLFLFADPLGSSDTGMDSHFTPIRKAGEDRQVIKGEWDK